VPVASVSTASIGIVIALSLGKWKIVKEDFSQGESDKPQKSLFEILKIKGVLASVFSQGLYCAMEFTIGTWGATYLVNVHLLSPAEAAKWVSLYFCGIMVGRIISGFISMKASDNAMIRGGIIVSGLGMILLSLPLGEASYFGLLLIGVGFGPIFPSVLHSVPDRFGEEYSADITGFHMGGAYGIGFAIQLVFGFVATATTFKITTFVLLAIAVVLFVVNEATISLVRKK
jgi:fucose permease